MPKIMTFDDETYVVMPKEEYQELIARAEGVALPEYPAADTRGARPAVAFSLVSMAREIITRRLAAGWTQEELAEKAGVRVETISRLERAKHRPQQNTIEKIDQALSDAGF